jgi:hypothetical protein
MVRHAKSVIPGGVLLPSHSHALRAACLIAVLAPAAAQADEMAFFMKNQYRRAVAVELSSRDRDQVWPGGDQVYLLEKGEAKSVPISCNAGENICYGAWVAGDDRTAWGVGPDRDKPCNDCCFICAEKTTAQIRVGP